MLVAESARFFRRHKALSLSAFFVLTLGIGISASILSIFLSLAENRIPGIEAGTYATVAVAPPHGPLAGITWKDLDRFRALAAGNAAVAASTPAVTRTIRGSASSVRVGVSAVSSQFLTVLGVKLIAGRDFSPADEGPAARVAIVGEQIARKLFGPPDRAMGQAIIIRKTPFRIVGVAPRDFRGIFEPAAEVWVSPSGVFPVIANPLGGYAAPYGAMIQGAIARGKFWQKTNVFLAVAKASPGTSQKQLLARLKEPTERMNLPALAATAGIVSDPDFSAYVLTWSRLAFLLSAALTLATALNFGGLLLARVPQQLDAVRLKRILGATSGRLVAELLAGPAALVVCATAAGTVLALWLRSLLMALAIFSARLPLLSSRLGFQAVWAEAGIALFVALALGGLPAFRLLRDSGTPSSARATTPRNTLRTLRGLVAFQIAIAMTASLLAVMIGRGVILIEQRDLGFKPEHVTEVVLDATQAGPSPILITTNTGNFALANLTNNALAALGRVPGVQLAAAGLDAPMLQPLATVPVRLAGQASSSEKLAAFVAASPDYFNVLGIRFLAGHAFSAGFFTGTPTEAVVSRALACELWPGREAIGQSVIVLSDDNSSLYSLRVVGVVEDARFTGPEHSSAPTLYAPLQGTVFGAPLVFVVRGPAPAQVIKQVVSRVFDDAIPGLGVAGSFSVPSRIRGAMAAQRWRAFGAFAGAVALLVVSYIGLFGALTFLVNIRRREIGIRMCFGATPQAILRSVLKDALILGMSAIVLSLVACALFAPMLHRFSLGAISWSTRLASAVLGACLLGALGVAAAPAASAALLAPMDILREE